MIKAEKNNNGKGYDIYLDGPYGELLQEVGSVAAMIVSGFYNDVLEQTDDKDMAQNMAEFAFAEIIERTNREVLEATGIDIIGDDDDAEDEKSKHTGNPFMMGMTGEAFAGFMRDMKGE